MGDASEETPEQEAGEDEDRARTIGHRSLHYVPLPIYRDEPEPSVREYQRLEEDRPRTRGDCEGGHRPCPYVGCKYNTFLDVKPNGSVVFNHRGDPHEVPPEKSCLLDMTENGGHTLEQVGEMLNLTRERVRQIEGKVLYRLQKNKDAREVFEAGGFEAGVVYNNDASLEGEGEGGGAGPTPAMGEKDAEEEWLERAYRIYERFSRERAQGIRISLTPEELQQLREYGRLLPEQRAPATPVQEGPLGKKMHELPLTDREQKVVAKYLELAKKTNAKPSPLAVAKALGFRGPNSNISASVCTALRAAIVKGTELPFYGQRGGGRRKKASEEAVPSSRRPRRVKEEMPVFYDPDPVPPEEADIASPVVEEGRDPPSTAMVALSTPDAFKSVLAARRKHLEAQLAAIDVLLSAS